MAQHGFKVCVGNRSPGKVDLTVERAKEEGNLPITGAKSFSELVSHLKKPRKIVILVQAGKPVDETINALSSYLEDGDIIIDGGNEWFENSIRRADMLTAKRINFIGMGISGGEEGARYGPSLMPGGPKLAYEAVAPIFEKCAAQVDGQGCVTYLGPIGSGNYVKMVHNGIECTYTPVSCRFALVIPDDLLFFRRRYAAYCGSLRRSKACCWNGK